MAWVERMERGVENINYSVQVPDFTHMRKETLIAPYDVVTARNTHGSYHKAIVPNTVQFCSTLLQGV